MQKTHIKFDNKNFLKPGNYPIVKYKDYLLKYIILPIGIFCHIEVWFGY